MRDADHEQRFTTTLEARPRGGVTVRMPFDPNEVWGTRPRHDIQGAIAGHGMRGQLIARAGGYVLELGPAWCGDPAMIGGATVNIVIRPEPPQLATVAPDIADAICADQAARDTFESIATHYRLNFVRWIEEAKRPETRAKRITETVAALSAGRRER